MTLLYLDSNIILNFPIQYLMYIFFSAELESHEQFTFILYFFICHISIVT